MPTEKIVNYTNEMVEVLLANVPFNHEKAKEFALTLGRNSQSIVAKLKRLEADETVKGERPFYIAKDAYVPKTGKPVEKKSDIVKNIEVLLGVANDVFKGLDKAAKAPLEKVRDAITSLYHDVDRLGELHQMECDRIHAANEAAKAVEAEAAADRQDVEDDANDMEEAEAISEKQAEAADDLQKAGTLVTEDRDRQDAECGGYAKYGDHVTKEAIEG